jgi:hypothetical protein
VERKAIKPPRSCFGLEQHAHNPACPNCPYQAECDELMGNLSGLVNVDEAIFKFLPTGLAERFFKKAALDPDVDDLEGLYVHCYQWVFESKPQLNKGLRKHLSFVQTAAAKLGVSVKLFLLTNMLGWKMTHQEFGETNRFSLAQVTNQKGIDCVKTYSDVCHKKYGTFDITSLDRLMESDIASKDAYAVLLNSEIIFGSWIVNHKLFHSGRVAETFYREKEVAMNPYWLASEPSYREDILIPFKDEQGRVVNKLLERHRWNAKQAVAKMKLTPLIALRIFRLREKAMTEAIHRVLAQRGLRAEHFQIERKPQVSALKFWVRLANAIQHYECLKFIEDYPSAYDGRFERL